MSRGCQQRQNSKLSSLTTAMAPEQHIFKVFAVPGKAMRRPACLVVTIIRLSYLWFAQSCTLGTLNVTIQRQSHSVAGVSCSSSVVLHRRTQLDVHMFHPLFSLAICPQAMRLLLIINAKSDGSAFGAAPVSVGIPPVCNVLLPAHIIMFPSYG